MKLGYKRTEVGVIPEEWEVKPLEKVFALKHGFAFSSENFSKSGPIVLTPGNFSLEGGLYFEDRNTTRYSGGYSPKTTFSRGDLLIVMTDLTPTCNLLGKPAFVETDEVILHNQRIGKVVLKDKSVHLPLLFYFLLSRTYLDHIKAQAVGSTVRHTSNRSIYSAQLAWPPLPEQRAIAAALSDMDALLGGLERLIAKKRDLKQAAMQKLLTGRTRLLGDWVMKPSYKQTEIGLIPEDWDVLPFKEQFNISAGGDVKPKLSSPVQDEEHCYPIYSNALTDKGLYGFCSYADHPANSITITAGAHLDLPLIATTSTRQLGAFSCFTRSDIVQALFSRSSSTDGSSSQSKAQASRN